ncbi:MAG: hypothetical protein JRF33_16240, partial [Deltaproteobacteria bacterium]|nr:hypothetical protein [Deltaproteobacteria bacterium]
MKGTCPGCSRAFDISEDFLRMGGKAKCPHCLLELDFGGPSPGEMTRDPRVDPTRTDYRRKWVDKEPRDEVDATCPECERRFKIERNYLVKGGIARCPHCAVDLSIEDEQFGKDLSVIEGSDHLATLAGRPPEPGEEAPAEEEQEAQEQADEFDETEISLDDLYANSSPGMEAGPRSREEALTFAGEKQDPRVETDEMQSPYGEEPAGPDPKVADGDMGLEDPFAAGASEGSSGDEEQGQSYDDILPDLSTEQDEEDEQTMEISSFLLGHEGEDPLGDLSDQIDFDDGPTHADRGASEEEAPQEEEEEAPQEEEEEEAPQEEEEEEAPQEEEEEAP